VLDFELDIAVIDRFRKIALTYLKNNKAHIIVQLDKQKYQLVFMRKDGNKEFDMAEFDSREDIEEYLQDDYLPNLGARIQQQKIRIFQWLL